MESNMVQPINAGSSESVTINQFADNVEKIAGIHVERNYNLTSPQGVNGCNSDNTMIQREFGWESSTSLRESLEKIYNWTQEMARSLQPA